ncbi:hypothetical protein vBRpoSV10_199 [Ruegeria phage vB_RpoS-V10]|nr:hypothetical protein DSS3P8_194 [Roseobacter phage DSS3P8]AWY09321.1 hypothetical protein vBRpoSV10_199 [Ruegeria phage vB_RpoS-V10]
MANTVEVPLLPCPSRCGNTPKLWVGLSEIIDGEVQCPCGWTSGNHPTAEEAAAVWNNRA